MFAAGLIFELREGIAQLNVVGLRARLGREGRKRWTRLARLAKLKYEDTVRQVRNCLAFHIGDERVARRGIQRLAAKRRKLVISTGDGSANVQARHDLGVDILLAGIEIRRRSWPLHTPNSRRPITRRDLAAALREASDNHFVLVGGLLEEIFIDALTQAGAKFEPLPQLPRGR
jgi:hypothetical protein